MTRRPALLTAALAAAVAAGCSVLRPIDDYHQEVWTLQKTDVKDRFSAVQFVDASTGYVLGENGMVLKTADGGGTWTPIYPIAVAGKRLVALSFLDALQGYMISDSTLYRTEDGGLTWKALQDFGATYTDTIRAVRFLTPAAGFVVGQKGVYQTLDGTTWVRADVTQGSAVEVAGASVFVAGNLLYRTALDGIYTGVPASGAVCAAKGDGSCGAAMHFLTPNEGWLLAGSSANGMLANWVFKRTHDGGQTWTEADPSGGLRKLAATIGASTPRVRFTSATHGWVIQDGDFAATQDGGQTWQRQVQFKKAGEFNKYDLGQKGYGYADISAPDATHAWLVGSDGRVYKWENRYYPPQIDDNDLQIGGWRCCP